MKPLPQRKNLGHTPPTWVKNDAIYFLTLCAANRRINTFASPTAFAAVSDSIQHYTLRSQIWIKLLVAMPDHLHLLASFPATQSMPLFIRDWKRYLAKTASFVWQDGFFDHRLRSLAEVDEKYSYIRMNPVRANLVSHPDAWPYSLAHENFNHLSPALAQSAH